MVHNFFFFSSMEEEDKALGEIVAFVSNLAVPDVLNSTPSDEIRKAVQGISDEEDAMSLFDQARKKRKDIIKYYAPLVLSQILSFPTGASFEDWLASCKLCNTNPIQWTPLEKEYLNQWFLTITSPAHAQGLAMDQKWKVCFAGYLWDQVRQMPKSMLQTNAAVSLLDETDSIREYLETPGMSLVRTEMNKFVTSMVYMRMTAEESREKIQFSRGPLYASKLNPEACLPIASERKEDNDEDEEDIYDLTTVRSRSRSPLRERRRDRSRSRSPVQQRPSAPTRQRPTNPIVHVERACSSSFGASQAAPSPCARLPKGAFMWSGWPSVQQNLMSRPDFRARQEKMDAYLASKALKKKQKKKAEFINDI